MSYFISWIQCDAFKKDFSLTHTLNLPAKEKLNKYMLITLSYKKRKEWNKLWKIQIKWFFFCIEKWHRSASFSIVDLIRKEKSLKLFLEIQTKKTFENKNLTKITWNYDAVRHKLYDTQFAASFLNIWAIFRRVADQYIGTSELKVKRNVTDQNAIHNKNIKTFYKWNLIFLKL